MGIFKQIKDMKATVAAAPDMIEQAQQMQANAQAMAANQQAAAAQAAAQAAASGPPAGPDFEPIAGVSLELYADISKSLATVNYEASSRTATSSSSRRRRSTRPGTRALRRAQGSSG
ncbi:MAG TPA: hypothetical protein DIU14_09625 [Actinobacteria bacterium]|nr:hypothetical protein [Actinomycetota bacterium]